MNQFYGFSPNRTVCSVLEEVRKMHEVHNYSGLIGLIEEVQVMANRMEAALYDKKDIIYAQNYIKELKKEIKELETKKEKLDD